MPSGPQTFDLQLYEVYHTGDPAAPLDGTNITGIITVTINWNAGGTDVLEKAVVFSDGDWGDAGKGPLTLYDEAMGGGTKPVGTVAWTAKPTFTKTKETDTPNNRYRWMITPVIDLVRTVTSTEGNPPEILVTYTASDNVPGGWIPLI